MAGGWAQAQTVGGGGAPHPFSPLFLLFLPAAPSREGGIRFSWGVGGTETGHQDLVACRRPSGGSGVTPALASPGQVGWRSRRPPPAVLAQGARRAASLSGAVLSLPQLGDELSPADVVGAQQILLQAGEADVQEYLAEAVIHRVQDQAFC